MRKRSSGLLLWNCVSVVGKPDLQITDETGKFITDSRAERDARQARFVQGVRAYGQNDPTTRAMLDSFRASRDERKNKLVYLYEIRAALVAQYGSDANAPMTLDICKREMDALGWHSSEEPVLQSRHWGKHAPNLRWATEDDLTQARDADLLMMEQYLVARRDHNE